MSSGLTHTNFTVGTVTYAAPEQLMGRDIDAHADQYALAATAFHLLTGAPPYPHTNPVVVISRHLTAPQPKLSDLRRNWPTSMKCSRGHWRRTPTTGSTDAATSPPPSPSGPTRTPTLITAPGPIPSSPADPGRPDPARGAGAESEAAQQALVPLTAAIMCGAHRRRRRAYMRQSSKVAAGGLAGVAEPGPRRRALDHDPAGSTAWICFDYDDEKQTTNGGRSDRYYRQDCFGGAFLLRAVLDALRLEANWTRRTCQAGAQINLNRAEKVRFVDAPQSAPCKRELGVAPLGQMDKSQSWHANVVSPKPVIRARAASAPSRHEDGTRGSTNVELQGQVAWSLSRRTASA